MESSARNGRGGAQAGVGSERTNMHTCACNKHAWVCMECVHSQALVGETGRAQTRKTSENNGKMKKFVNTARARKREHRWARECTWLKCIVCSVKFAIINSLNIGKQFRNIFDYYIPVYNILHRKRHMKLINIIKNYIHVLRCILSNIENSNSADGDNLSICIE